MSDIEQRAIDRADGTAAYEQSWKSAALADYEWNWTHGGKEKFAEFERKWMALTDQQKAGLSVASWRWQLTQPEYEEMVDLLYRRLT